MPRLTSFGDDLSDDSAACWELINRLGRAKLLTVSRGTDVLSCKIDNWRRFEAAGDGWSFVISAERTVETVEIELQIGEEKFAFIYNCAHGSFPKELMSTLSIGAKVVYEFPRAKVIFREAWKDSERARNIRSIIDFRPESDEPELRGYLLLAALLHWHFLPRADTGD